jgi:predicted phosphodiesterase
MRVGILADVHANLPALDAALSALRSHGIERLACAGDLVGYGPHPNECVSVLAEAGAVCVAGNHDLIALGRLADDGCVPVARQSLAWTAHQLTDESRGFLARLPLAATVAERIVLAHGALGDPVAKVRGPQVPGQVAALTREHPAARLLVLGHTHEPAGWDAGGRPIPHRAGTVSLPLGRAVLNPGAVGQTRSRWLREPRVLARALVVDLDRDTATWVASPYPPASVRAALRRAGLPPRTYRMAAPLRRAVGARLRGS